MTSTTKKANSSKANAKPKTKNPSRAAKAAKEAADLLAESSQQAPNFFLQFLKKYRDDPVGFVRDVLRVRPTRGR
jgi:hypothetical protein